MKSTSKIHKSEILTCLETAEEQHLTFLHLRVMFPHLPKLHTLHPPHEELGTTGDMLPNSRLGHLNRHQEMLILSSPPDWPALALPHSRLFFSYLFAQEFKDLCWWENRKKATLVMVQCLATTSHTIFQQKLLSVWGPGRWYSRVKTAGKEVKQSSYSEQLPCKSSKWDSRPMKN